MCGNRQRSTRNYGNDNSFHHRVKSVICDLLFHVNAVLWKRFIHACTCILINASSNSCSAKEYVYARLIPMQLSVIHFVENWSVQYWRVLRLDFRCTEKLGIRLHIVLPVQRIVLVIRTRHSLFTVSLLWWSRVKFLHTNYWTQDCSHLCIHLLQPICA